MNWDFLELKQVTISALLSYAHFQNTELSNQPRQIALHKPLALTPHQFTLIKRK